MNSADAIIANLTPFRGIAAAIGTCFELGYTCAQGKVAFACTNVSPDNDEPTRRFYAGEVMRESAGLERGPDGILIETLGFADTLMLHGGFLNRGGVVVVGDAPEDKLCTGMEAFKSVLGLAAIKSG